MRCSHSPFHPRQKTTGITISAAHFAYRFYEQPAASWNGRIWFENYHYCLSRLLAPNCLSRCDFFIVRINCSTEYFLYKMTIFRWKFYINEQYIWAKLVAKRKLCNSKCKCKDPFFVKKAAAKPPFTHNFKPQNFCIFSFLNLNVVLRSRLVTRN